MNKYLKYFLYFVGALLGLFVLILVYTVISYAATDKSLGLQWDSMFYEPPTQIRGVEIGMHERDVVFLLGKPSRCDLTYRITNNDTGETIRVTGDAPPTQALPLLSDHRIYSLAS